MTQTLAAIQPGTSLPLALIQKPPKGEIVRTSVKPTEALTVESQNPGERLPVSVIANVHDLPDGWTRGGLNE